MLENFKTNVWIYLFALCLLVGVFSLALVATALTYPGEDLTGMMRAWCLCMGFPVATAAILCAHYTISRYEQM